MQQEEVLVIIFEDNVCVFVCICSDCQETEPYSQALDEEVSERLWDLSMEFNSGAYQEDDGMLQTTMNISNRFVNLSRGLASRMQMVNHSMTTCRVICTRFNQDGKLRLAWLDNYEHI